ncbi:MAG: hypothetical protein IKS35_00545 [Clostridia bacterium]|nr:hypothetical protein [Clostridia bacterium]
MGQKSGYTHGGSAGKNFALLFRAVFNLIGVGLLGFGLSMWENPGDFASFPVPAIVGAAVCGIGLVINLIGPFLHRSGR